MNPCFRRACARLVVLACAGVAAPGGSPASAIESDVQPAATPAAVAGQYDAVTRHLEPGGVVYGYFNIDGDLAALGGLLERTIDEVIEDHPWSLFFKGHVDAVLDGLGLHDVTAIGLSSVARPDGLFDNRTFFHTPRGRRGLLGVLGGDPAPFRTAGLAPAEADFFYEAEFDIAGLYRELSAVFTRVGGRRLAGFVDEELGESFAPVGLTLLDVIRQAKGRITVALVVDPERTAWIQLDVPVKVPACSGFVRIEGLGRTLVPLLDQIPILELSIRDGRRHYAIVGEPLVSTWTPAFVVEGDTLYLGTSQAFIVESLGRRGGLADAPAFRAALAEVGAEGNALTYLSPRLLRQAGRVLELNSASRSESLRELRSFLPEGREVTVSLVSVRSNLPDGILWRSRWDHSLKRDLVISGMLNPATVGMSVVIVGPLYERARAKSEETAIFNNLRRLQLHARKYCYDHGVRTVPITEVMGDEPGKLVPLLAPVAGEDYLRLVFVEDQPLRITTEDGRVIEFGP